jgi:hypothetical protein
MLRVLRVVNFFLKIFAGLVFACFLLAARTWLLSFEHICFICFSTIIVMLMYAEMDREERDESGKAGKSNHNGE